MWLVPVSKHGWGIGSGYPVFLIAQLPESCLLKPPQDSCRQQQSELGRKLLATTSTTGGDDATATNGCHARTEAVAMLADELARLIGPFHVSVSADISLSVNPMGCASEGSRIQRPSGSHLTAVWRGV